MSENENLRLLFIINPASGNSKTNWPQLITAYFAMLPHTIELYQLPAEYSVQTVKDKITHFSPHYVIAVGGDGTVKLVAECILQKNISLGILPAGSANGLAKELGIGDDPAKALDVLVNGCMQKIHVTEINGQLCIHLSDIGLNAYAMKMFNMQVVRGMWGYFKAILKVLWNHPKLEIEMQGNNKAIKITAAIIVIANGTKYGTGAVINPIGKLNDEVFEVIAVKKIAVYEIFKMFFSHAPYNINKTQIFQTSALSIRSVKKVHFQIDGEYLGRINEVKAILIPDALQMIVPVPDTNVTIL